MIRRRRLSRRRCEVCGKWLYRSYRRAAKTLARLPEPGGSVYWSPPCGGWHLTGSSRAEYDRRRQAHLPPSTHDGSSA